MSKGKTGGGKPSAQSKSKSKAKDWRKDDPAFDRESKRYDNPVPSRELILQTLEDHGKPMSRQALAGHFGLRDERDQDGLNNRLGAMIRDAQLVENRRQALGLVKEMDLIAGRVIAHRDGFGFLTPDDGGDDLFLNPRQMKTLMHGDRALVRLVNVDDRGRREGSLVDVLERGTNELVGRFMREHGVTFVVPDNTRLTQDVMIGERDSAKAKPGDIVVVELLAHPSKRAQPVGKVIEVLGKQFAPGMEIDIAVRSHNIPFEWPREVEQQIGKLSAEVPEADKQGRTDLRDTPLVTIDGEDARDFDDAVYAKPTRSGWKLLVAIADVSAYVTPDSPLDAEAHTRGTSVYFPGSVIPMLPEVLSNGLCSLNPHVDRLCMVCEMTVTRDGQVKRSKFYEAVMNSKARLTYNEVGEHFDDPDAADTLGGVDADFLSDHLFDLKDCFDALYAARQARGAINFESNETRIVFGDSQKIERIVPVTRNVAHKLIEECMIAANVQAALRLSKAKVPTLYRVHDRPPTEKLDDLRTFLGERGLSLGGGKEPGATDYSKVMEIAATRDDRTLLQSVLLRSMSQAVYTPANNGHFGLSLDAYAHFTSPIRRYPDLLVHRGLKHANTRQKPAKFRYSEPDMEALGTHCSGTERRADEASRDVMDWLKCEYMQEHVGKEFAGIIVSVTSFGLFVELDGIYATGLVHVSQLNNDYYHFEAKQHCLRGDRTGRTYRLSDKMRVRVLRVDLDERKIDFEPAESGSGDQKGGSTSGDAAAKSKRRRRKRKRS